jgi:hypothetical protein
LSVAFELWHGTHPQLSAAFAPLRDLFLPLKGDSMQTPRFHPRVFRTSLIVVISLAIAVFGWAGREGHPTGSSGVFSLKPPFMGVAYAEGSASPADIGEQLDEEAGIAAYYKSPDAITLSQVRAQFRTIEVETVDYIIGSVAVPSHPENFDTHVYVHNTGWILAYYLRGDPVSKILDVNARTTNTTKLKTVVAAIAGAAGAPFTDVTYYDFRYPNATNLMLVAEDYANGHDFDITLPSAYGYFERGWAVYDTNNDYVLAVDNAYQTAQWSGNSMYYGTLTASQLLPDTAHNIRVDIDDNAYGILVIVYRVP